MQKIKNKKTIDESDFKCIAAEEGCRACLSERSDALTPKYFKYTILANDFIKKNTYPTWRTNHDQTKYIGSFQTPPTEAFPISYHELALRLNLFSAIKFNPNTNYFTKSKNIIAFYCESCGVRVVKDGNHRLLQCAVQGCSFEITIYEVSSKDWRNCKVDMKNFCKCISNNHLNQNAPKRGGA